MTSRMSIRRWIAATVVFASAAGTTFLAAESSDAAVHAAPATKQTVRWLALGDSYSSGEGIPGTTSAANQQGLDDCARATGENSTAKSYAVVAAERLADDDRYVFEAPFLVACTGAITDGAWTQLDEMRNRVQPDTLEKWNVISYSFGGNNVGFADILKDCTDLNNWGALNIFSPGCSTTEQQMRDSIDVLVGNRELGDGVLYIGRADRRLQDVFDKTAEFVTPGGHVVVVGYPNFVEESGRWKAWRKLLNSCENISPEDGGMLRSAAGYLNQQIGAAVLKADKKWGPEGIHFHFVDISSTVYEKSADDSDRHGLCTQSPWLNGISVGIPTSGDIRLERSFHPKQQGHTATGEYVASLVTEYDFTQPDPSDSVELTQASRGDRVTELQTDLSAAGYDIGVVDGYFGLQTAAGVAAFQADQNANVTGIADQSLLDLAAAVAAQAPECSLTTILAGATALDNGWEWESNPSCVPGWAVASAFLPDSAASEHRLYRVRGSSWVEVSINRSREATTFLAAGTPLSMATFALHFGTDGWPGRVSSANDVANFIMFDATSQAGTLPGAWDLVQMWLDTDGFDAWLEWLYEGPTEGVLEPCVGAESYAAVSESSEFFLQPVWRCRYSTTAGFVWEVIVDKRLSSATFVLAYIED